MCILVEKEEVLDKIIDVMVNKLQVNINCVIKENYYKPLTGSVFCLQATAMTYLFFEIEKAFNIIIMPVDILNGEFNTMNGIAEVIIKYKLKEVI